MEFLKRVGTFFLDSIQAVLILASILMVLYAFVIQPHEVSGNSMHPTFKDKEFLLSYLLDVKRDKYQVGDVIVFHSPVEVDKLYIKRIIGVPGDSIMVLDGGVYNNNVRMDESAYLSSEVRTSSGSSFPEGVAVVVPEGKLVVMGDNRPGSSDSREWGVLDKKKVIGRSVVRILPFSEFGLIKNPFIQQEK
jgi:signal peptidase I